MIRSPSGPEDAVAVAVPVAGACSSSPCAKVTRCSTRARTGVVARRRASAPTSWASGSGGAGTAAGVGAIVSCGGTARARRTRADARHMRPGPMTAAAWRQGAQVADVPVMLLQGPDRRDPGRSSLTVQGDASLAPARSAPSFTTSAKTTASTTQRTSRSPPRTARCAPARPPANCPAAMGSATCQATRPRDAKSATAARLEAKFTTLASAEASRMPGAEEEDEAEDEEGPGPRAEEAVVGRR